MSELDGVDISKALGAEESPKKNGSQFKFKSHTLAYRTASGSAGSLFLLGFYVMFCRSLWMKVSAKYLNYNYITTVYGPLTMTRSPMGFWLVCLNARSQHIYK